MYAVTPDGEKESDMRLTFEVDGTAIELSRNFWTGQATLKTGTDTIVLQEAGDVATHFDFQLTKHWQCSVMGRDIRIEKQRPVLLAGLRPQTYRVFVDGELVQERKGF
jgi:hypothetical protein